MNIHQPTSTPQFTTTELNNCGARLIEKRNYGQAIQYLSAAFHGCKSQFEREAENQENTCSSASLPCSVDFWMIQDISNSSSGQQACQDDFVYKHPIHIPAKATSTSELNIAVATTFNLALAYHLATVESRHGFAQNQDIETAMRQALRLYQYTFRLQRTQAKSSDSPRFFMACINNIGILFRMLEEFQQSAECFNHLLALLMYLSSVGMAEPSDLETFFHNTARLSCDSCNIGAAAA